MNLKNNTMPNLNKVMLIGNLTRDPETSYTPKGTAVTEIALAVNRVWQDDQGAKREETTFVDITFWGKAGETVAKHTRKGEPLYVEGRLQMDSWEDKQTGQKRSKLKVVGESFQFLGSKGDGDSKPAEQREPRRTAERPDQQPGFRSREQQRDEGFAAEGLGPDTEDDIPF